MRRTTLAARHGERFRVTATIERFSQKNAFRGPQKTVLLRDVRDAETGDLLTDHLWFAWGKWAFMLREGEAIAFDARVTGYDKGYHGRREDLYDAPPPSSDWRLERPTRVARVPPQAQAGGTP